MINETQYRLVAESLPDGLLAMDEQGKIKLYNPAAERIFGYQAEEILGQDVRSLMHGSDSLSYDTLVRDVRGEGMAGISREAKGLRKDGTAVSLRVAVNEIRSDGESLLIVLASDISGEKQAEQELRRMQAETLHAAKLAAVGELAAGAAHEINNPLTGIINYAQILLDVLALDARQAGMLQKIIDGGMRISGIVNNLRKLARSSSDIREEVQIADLIEASMQLVGAQLRNHGVQVHIELAPDLDRLRCSSTDLQQLFMNLMTNAREALDEKYPTSGDEKLLRISGRMISRDDAPHIQLVFYDQGCGMTQDVMDRLSTPFFSTKTGNQHVGLGLFAGFAIVRDHGGHLHFESAAEEWTRVTVELPLTGESTSA